MLCTEHASWARATFATDLCGHMGNTRGGTGSLANAWGGQDAREDRRVAIARSGRDHVGAFSYRSADCLSTRVLLLGAHVLR